MTAREEARRDLRRGRAPADRRQRLRARPSRGHRSEFVHQDRFRQEPGGVVTGNALSSICGELSMSEPTIRDRLVGGWRLTGYEVTAGGKTDHPLGEDPLGTILYTPDGYMSAQLAGPGPYEDDDQPDASYSAYSEPDHVGE